MRTRYCLSRDACDQAVLAGVAHAATQGWRVTVAIVDDGGTPVHVTRMDDASPASVETAIQKARSSALTGMDTNILEAMVEKRPGVATMGRVAVEGGVAVLWQGQRVGGIGVSGVQSHQDAEVAGAALTALLAVESD